MTKKLTLGIAQTVPAQCDFEANMQLHCEMAEHAATQGVTVLLFPELSLTGYELPRAEEFAMSDDDPRLQPLRDIADEHDMIILAGGPRKGSGDKPNLGLFIIQPNQETTCYCKMNLHGEEVKYYEPGTEHVLLPFEKHSIALAICADTANPEHAAEAARLGATCYLGSIVCRLPGIEEDAAMYQGYAEEHNMTVAVANHSGETGGYDCAGKSAVWSPAGLVARAEDDGFALIVAYLDAEDEPEE